MHSSQQMIPFVEKVTDVTISILEETASRQASIDVYHLLQCLTLDIISAEAFAVHTNAQREGTNNSLFRSAKTIFDNPLTSKVLTIGCKLIVSYILKQIKDFCNMHLTNIINLIYFSDFTKIKYHYCNQEMLVKWIYLYKIFLSKLFP